MNLIPTVITQGLARQGLTLSQKSPAILFGVGVAGMIGSTVLACRATRKIDEKLDTTKKELEKVKTANYAAKDLTERDRKHDLAITYRDGAFTVIKAYAPAVLLGAAAIACLAKSHNILVQRNAALTAAYVAVDEAFKRYRGRVREKYGVEEDLHLMHDSEPVDVLNENGNITHSTRVSPQTPSQYSRFFDKLCSEWSPDPEYSRIWLEQAQEYWNHILITRGHVFLNEVYEHLGMEHTKAGAVVGWVLTKDGSTDNFVDFGLYTDNPRAWDFMNGREGAILLDFNVDGLIFDKINTRTEKLKWQS